MSHTEELQIIEFIQHYRTPALDAFFRFLDLFDTQPFFFILIPLFWFGKNWKVGLRLFYILFLNNLINHLLKAFFHSPRPFHIEESLGIIQVNGYGFPSGAAQTVILLSGILVTEWKSRWRWIVASAYILLISFSRIYLGLHFPTDILGGWVVGFALWMVYAYVRPPLEKRLETWKPSSVFLLSQFVPLALLLWHPFASLIRLSGCAMGMGLGVFVNHVCGWHLGTSKTQKQFVTRALLGVGGTIVGYFLLSLLSFPHAPLYSFFKYYILGLWVATGVLWICRMGNKHA